MSLKEEINLIDKKITQDKIEWVVANSLSRRGLITRSQF